MDPGFWLNYNFLGCAYLQKQMNLEAIAAFRTSVRLSKNDPGALASLAYAYGVQGRTTDAAEILKQLLELAKTRYVHASEMATACLGLRQVDRARSYMEQAHQQRDFRLIYLRVDPRFAELRGDL
jgi:Flp pilus assembly protein TadD